jgi:hypothetical protein
MVILMLIRFHEMKDVKKGVLVGGICGMLLVSTAFAGYKSQKVKLDPAGSYACHLKQGTLTIAADPYQPWEKLKTAFDLKELDQMGVIPIQVVLTNDGEDTIVVDGREIHLLDGKNRSIEGMDVEDVVRVVMGKSAPPTQKNPSKSPLPFPRSGGRRGDIFEIETDLTNKSLGEVRVAPKSTLGGFLYFQLPENQRNLHGYKVYVPEIRNLRSGEPLLFFEIDLK